MLDPSRTYAEPQDAPEPEPVLESPGRAYVAQDDGCAVFTGTTVKDAQRKAQRFAAARAYESMKFDEFMESGGEPEHFAVDA